MTRSKLSPVLLVCSCDLDVGEIPALVGQRLVEEHFLDARSLAKIADMPAMAERLQHHQPVVVVDGCLSACARKALGRCGIECSKHLELGSLGLSKGCTPAETTTVERVTEVAKLYLA